MVKHRHKFTGEVLWTEFEADPATTRHYLDKVLPNARQEIDMNIHGAVKVFTNVDPYAGRKKS